MLSHSDLDKSKSCHAAWAGKGQGKWSEGHRKYSRSIPRGMIMG